MKQRLGEVTGVAAIALLLAAVSACEPESLAEPAPAPDAAPLAPLEASLEPPSPTLAAAPAHTRWTFAVLSDLHLPNPRDAHVDEVIAALVAMHVRLVVVTGDHTNGNDHDHVRSFRGEGWAEVRQALEPLHAAGIAVLPVAGNHDSYLPWQRDEYEEAFRDLTRWAAPLEINAPTSAEGHGRPPFSYSVDVDGVHFSLAHLVATSVEREVGRWLETDLARAATARHRIVFGHVPMSSVIRPPHPSYVRNLGTLLERGHADMLVAGHEHTTWDEDVRLPAGGLLRQVLVGCASGVYVYGPSDRERARAGCAPIVPRSKRRLQCSMPHGGGAFELTLRRTDSYIEHARIAFTLIDVDGDTLDVRPMTLDKAGRPIPFYLDAR